MTVFGNVQRGFRVMAGAELFGFGLDLRRQCCLHVRLIRLSVLFAFVVVVFVNATNTSPPRRNLQVKNKAKVGKTINVSCQSTSLPVFPFVLPEGHKVRLRHVRSPLDLHADTRFVEVLHAAPPLLFSKHYARLPRTGYRAHLTSYDECI